MATTESVLITGGAGYIGSHLVDRFLARGSRVRVLDNLSTGNLGFIQAAVDDGTVELIQGDLLTADLGPSLAGIDLVFHAAANADARLSDPLLHFEQNVFATERLLRQMDIAGVGGVAFTSTSTVYGEAAVIPTPEDYGPKRPISTYGSSKLAAEMLIEAWAAQGDRRATIFRFANVVGGRATHGVIPDLVAKLLKTPETLEILGSPPGTVKSYVHIDDVVSGILAGLEPSSHESSGVYNLGAPGQTTVQYIADEVCRQTGNPDAERKWMGGVDGGGGWVGDVRAMALSIDRLRATGWQPKWNSNQAIAEAIGETIAAT